jgi:hypothetical protein
VKQHTITLSGREVLLNLDLKESELPSWLQTRAQEHYGVITDCGKHLGSVFLANGVWKVFYTSVAEANGTLEGCLKWLYNNN